MKDRVWDEKINRLALIFLQSTENKILLARIEYSFVEIVHGFVWCILSAYRFHAML